MSKHLWPSIPKTWRFVSVAEVAKIVYGKTLRKEERKAGNIPVYGSNGVVGRHNIALHPGNTIVIGRKGTAGAVHYVTTPFWSIDTTFYLDEISEIVDIEFLAHALRIVDLPRLSIVVGVPGINRKEIEKVQIPLPPLPEQRRIAEILHQADMLCQWRWEANAKLDNLASSILVEMFGNPTEWKSSIPLGHLVDFIGGGTPSRQIKEYFAGLIPWATSKDIKSRYLDDAQEHITEEAVQNSATNLVPSNTILVVVKSKILMHSLPIGITTRPFCFGQDIKGLICKPGVVPQFIVAAMLAQKQYILAQARGVNTEGLTLDILRQIPIPKVTKDQQREFLNRILVCDELHTNARTSQKHLDNLFPSLLISAFTGELTATWRDKRKDELQRAAVERDKKLGSRGEVTTMKDAIEGRLTPEEEERFREMTTRIAEKMASLQPNMPNITEKLVAIPDFSGLEILANRMGDQALMIQNIQKALSVFSLKMQTALAQMAPVFNTTGSLTDALMRSTEAFRDAFARSLVNIAAEIARREKELAYVELTEKQKGIFDILQQEKGYFSAKSISQKHDLQQQEIIDALTLFEAIGLVVKVDIPDETNSTSAFPVFESAYRNSHSSDVSRDDDLAVLRQNIESAT